MKNGVKSMIAATIISVSVATIILNATNKDILEMAFIELFIQIILFSIFAVYMEWLEEKRARGMITKRREKDEQGNNCW